MWQRLRVRISRLSLHTKIVLALFFTGLVPIGGAAATLASLLGPPAVVDQSLALATTYARDLIVSALEQRRKGMAEVAADPMLRVPGAPAAGVEARLNQYRASFGGFEALALLSTQGHLLATSSGHDSHSWLLDDGFVRARRGEVAVSGSPPPGNGLAPLLQVSAPVRGADGQIWAVAVGAVSIPALTEPVARLRMGRTGHGLLVAADGRLLAHPDPARIGRAWSSAALMQASGAVAANRPPAVQVVDEDGVQQVYALARIPASLVPGGWIVFARVPAAELYGHAFSARRVFWLVPTGLAIMVMAAALLLSGALRRPLREAAVAARRIAFGDFSQRLVVGGGDEVGELADAFNAMALQLEAKIQELEASRRRIVAGQETLRRQMAEQLHGPVQTRLLVVWHRLGEVERLFESDPAQALAELQEIRTELDRLREEDVRGISHRLHPSIVSVGLVPSLRSLRDRYERILPVELEIDPEFEAAEDAQLLPEEVTLAAYRAVDEALSNAIKHAASTRVRVEARFERGRLLHLTVQDDGRGFAPTQSGSGLGMRLMQDYLAALGGAFLVHSRRGDGTRVNIVIPVHHLPTQHEFRRAADAD